MELMWSVPLCREEQKRVPVLVIAQKCDMSAGDGVRPESLTKHYGTQYTGSVWIESSCLDPAELVDLFDW